MRTRAGAEMRKTIPPPKPRNWYRDYVQFRERADWLGYEWALFIKTKYHGSRK